MKNDIAIKVSGVSKTFKEQAGSRSFKEAFVNAGRILTGNKEKIPRKGDFTALNDINFEVKHGEFFGIVGRNGSGKSTLLKILAGVYTPSAGTVQINGKLTPFIELGVGFNPELSGRDNVFLNGALLGFTRKQMDEMYDDIVDFAELQDFMDMKLKHYSSGMQVRLAFSVAIRAESDILLIDEVLAVGDADFQKKCLDYFEELKSKNRTVCFVSHDMGSIEKFCDRVLVVNKSRVIGVYDAFEGSMVYKNINSGSVDSTDYEKPKSGKIIKSVNIVDIKKIEGKLKAGTTKLINININGEAIDNKIWNKGSFKFSFNIFNDSGVLVVSEETKDKYELSTVSTLTASISKCALNSGRYFAYFGIYGEDIDGKNKCIEATTAPLIFDIEKTNTSKGLLYNEVSWEIE
jgi:ABC-2 type transport system ATP-binding protein